MVLQIRLVGPHDEVERARKHIRKMSGKKIWSGPYIIKDGEAVE